MSYYLLHISNIPREDEELLSLKCFELGALGVSEKLNFRQTAADYEPETLVAEILELDVYFDQSPGMDALQELQAYFPEVQVQLSEEAEKDWLEEWKKGFEAFSLVKGIWIVPSWLKPPAEAETVISMDPGMAFGTGTHATTQLASEMLWPLKPEASTPLTLLDVGTGTGVLAILAEHLGFSGIQGTEIEPMAREVAKENIERNQSRRIQILDIQVDEIKKEFDVVVANIIDGILLRISADLKARVKPGGFLLLTGIIDERSENFVHDFIGKDPFELQKSSRKGEWNAYLLKRLA